MMVLVALEFYQYLSFPYPALIPPVPGAGFHPGPPPPSPEKKGIGSHPPVRYFLEQPLQKRRATATALC